MEEDADEEVRASVVDDDAHDPSADVTRHNIDCIRKARPPTYHDGGKFYLTVIKRARQQTARVSKKKKKFEL